MFETFLSVLFFYLILKFIFRIVYSGISLQASATQLRTQKMAARSMRDAQRRAQQQAYQAPPAMPAAPAIPTAPTVPAAPAAQATAKAATAAAPKPAATVNEQAAAFLKDAAARKRPK